MTTHKEALTLVLEALELTVSPSPSVAEIKAKAWSVGKEALAQPEQEPYAWEFAGTIFHDRKEVFDWYERGDISDIPPLALYTTPPQRTWVGLTDDEFQLIYDMGRTPAGMMEMVEAKLKEKNA